MAYRAIALAGGYAAELGCWDELMLLHRLLEEGNGAKRQRRHEREGGMRLVLRRLADETVPPAVRRRSDDTTTPEVQTMTIHREGRFDRAAAAGAPA